MTVRGDAFRTEAHAQSLMPRIKYLSNMLGVDVYVLAKEYILPKPVPSF